MKIRVLSLALIVALACGCGRFGKAWSPQEASLRCGGVGTGLTAVVAGMENAFFTATSRQTITVKPGVGVKTEGGKDGKPPTVTLSRDNDMSVSCACPAGCAEHPPVGCVIAQSPPGSPIVTCGGDCFTDNGCCFGCGWVF